jgi:mannose-6-phosphate isomerase-like protein (cupin superfamily)
MRIIRFDSMPFVPAGHENPLSPGVVRKALLQRPDLQPGCVQMVNWASLGVGKRFARHYHEDMQEIFVLVQGEAEITVGDQRAMLRCGDAVVIEPREIHEMENRGSQSVEYVAIGITSEEGGRTVVVE